jgi:tetratricopeptide (TPR) repeat protein
MRMRPIGCLAAVVLTVGVAVQAASQQDAPAADPPVTKESTDIRALQREFRRLIEANKMTDALPIAQRLVELSEGYSLAQRIGARFDLAALRRELDDLDGAVLEYNVVISIAKDANDLGAYLGIVYDNVATIRRVQEQWEAAEAASDRALEIFEKTLGKSVLALDYSERALAVLRESFAGNPKALEPFLEDNRRIRSELPR